MKKIFYVLSFSLFFLNAAENFATEGTGEVESEVSFYEVGKSGGGTWLVSSSLAAAFLGVFAGAVNLSVIRKQPMFPLVASVGLTAGMIAGVYYISEKYCEDGPKGSFSWYIRRAVDGAALFSFIASPVLLCHKNFNRFAYESCSNSSFRRGNSIFQNIFGFFKLKDLEKKFDRQDEESRKIILRNQDLVLKNKKLKKELKELKELKDKKKSNEALEKKEDI